MATWSPPSARKSARAEQTHFWQDGDTVLPGHEPHFDFKQIHTLVQTIEAHNPAWRDWFTEFDVTPHLVCHEDLATDPAGVTCGILAFLGLRLPGHRLIVPGTRPQADQLNHDWIARYCAALTSPSRRTER